LTTPIRLKLAEPYYEKGKENDKIEMNDIFSQTVSSSINHIKQRILINEKQNYVK
jgi:hypothetical protein